MRREVTGAQRARFARPCRGNIRGARVFAQRRLPGSATRSKSMKRALVLALTLWSGLATADDYPQRTVAFLCPFPAGGGTDILTRMLAHELQEKLARPVIVDNRPGAGTIVAAQAAGRAAPAGHTLLVSPVTTLAMAPSVHKSLPYDPVKDFAPIGLVGSAQFALVANPQAPAATLPELIAFIRSKNGDLSYASSGAATPHHLFMAMFLKMICGEAQHVPYRGSVAALTDVVSRPVTMMMGDLAVAIPAIKEGKGKGFGGDNTAPMKASTGRATQA